MKMQLDCIFVPWAAKVDPWESKDRGWTRPENHHHIRFEGARNGLLEKVMRVKEVAAEIGFSD
jgi:hypothetical protein